MCFKNIPVVDQWLSYTVIILIILYWHSSTWGGCSEGLDAFRFFLNSININTLEYLFCFVSQVLFFFLCRPPLHVLHVPMQCNFRQRRTNIELLGFWILKSSFDTKRPICYCNLLLRTVVMSISSIFSYQRLLHSSTYSNLCRWTSSLPSCLWSLRTFPSLPGSRLTISYRDASSALLQLVNQWLNFTYSLSHAFRYERKNTNPTLIRIEL